MSARTTCSASAGPAGRPARASCSATGRCARTAASPAGPTRRWPSATPAGRCPRRCAGRRVVRRARAAAAAAAAAGRPGQPGHGRGGLAPAARHDRAGGAGRRAVLAGAAGPGRPDGGRRADAVGRLAVADARPGRGRPRRARRDPHRPPGSASPPCAATATPVGIGRVSVEGEWAGVTSVDVAPVGATAGHRHPRSCASCSSGRERRARRRRTCRCGRPTPRALRLYAALGYVTHHPYGYRAPCYAGSVVVRW